MNGRELLEDFTVTLSTPDEVYNVLKGGRRNSVTLSVLDPSGVPVVYLLMVFDDGVNPERFLPLVTQYLRGYTTRISRLRSSLSRIRSSERGSVTNLVDSGDDL